MSCECADKLDSVANGNYGKNECKIFLFKTGNPDFLKVGRDLISGDARKYNVLFHWAFL